MHGMHYDLKCRNGCGFYGNPAWQGLCSKCYRDSQPPPQPLLPPPQSVNTSPSLSHPSPAHPPLLSPGRDDKKRTQQRKSRTRSFFRKTPTKEGEPGVGQAQWWGGGGADSEQAAEEFRASLEQAGLGPWAQRELQRRLGEAVRAVKSLPLGCPVDEMVNAAQGLYQNLLAGGIGDRMDQTVREKVEDAAERAATVLLYKRIFCPIGTDDEEKDLSMQSRIRELSWVTARHLDCNILESDPRVRDLLCEAMDAILGMDSARAPQDKLSALVRCSQRVFEVLRLWGGGEGCGKEDGLGSVEEGGGGADEFLPALIYVVLRANPPRLPSNAAFVTRFAVPRRLQSGEGGYYFTNLCCALAFLQEMGADSLGMPQDEFEGRVRGEAAPWDATAQQFVPCSALQGLTQDLAALRRLEGRRRRVVDEAKQMVEDSKKVLEKTTKEVDEVRAKTPLVVEDRPPLPADWLSRGLPSRKTKDEAAKAPKRNSGPSLLDIPLAEETRLPPPDICPSSLVTMSPGYRGFTAQGYQIPSIPCETGASAKKIEEKEEEKDGRDEESE